MWDISDRAGVTMNTKEKFNPGSFVPQIVPTIAFVPEAVQTIHGKTTNSCITYDMNGKPSRCYETVDQVFQSYAWYVALNKQIEVEERKKPFIKTKYGYELYNQQRFIKVEMQQVTPTMGYIDVFAIQRLAIQPPYFTIFGMKNGIYIPASVTFATAMEKINAAQNYYDPKGEHHTLLIGCEVDMAISNADMHRHLEVSLQNGNKKLDITNVYQARFIGDVCNYLLSFPPNQLLEKINGLDKRVTAGIKRMEEIEKQLDEGAKAAGIDQNQSAREKELEKELSEAKKEMEILQNEKMGLLQALQARENVQSIGTES